MKQTVLLLFTILILSSAYSQKVAIGLFGGVSNYMGDLTETVFLNETHPSVGAFVKYNANPFVTFRFGITNAPLSGNDQNFQNIDAAKVTRNLSFKSNLLEAALIVELNLFGYDVEDRRFSPYLFGGVAGFYHNPKALYQGEWIRLQPLGTEGQGTTIFTDRKPYSLYQLSIPMGIGFKIGMGSGITLAIEGGARKTFTDYIDDVSKTYVDANVLILENGEMAYNLSNRTGEVNNGVPLDLGNNDLRGDSSTQDWYMMAGLTISYTLGVPMSSGGGRNKKGCYDF
jgi:Domain of unknown function (DUF6089)